MVRVVTYKRQRYRGIYVTMTDRVMEYIIQSDKFYGQSGCLWKTEVWNILDMKDRVIEYNRKRD